jgi:hypothetical protein
MSEIGMQFLHSRFPAQVLHLRAAHALPQPSRQALHRVCVECAFAGEVAQQLQALRGVGRGHVQYVVEAALSDLISNMKKSATVTQIQMVRPTTANYHQHRTLRMSAASMKSSLFVAPSTMTPPLELRALAL